jgi:hypothetical protein
MSGRRRFSQRAVIQAIQEARSIKTVAARRLGCARKTVTNYINRYPAVKAAYEDAREALVDTAEAAMLTRLDRKEWPVIHFVLVTLGKDRGYSERHEVQQVPQQLSFLDFEDSLQRAYGDDYVPPEEDGQ